MQLFHEPIICTIPSRAHIILNLDRNDFSAPEYNIGKDKTMLWGRKDFPSLMMSYLQ